MKQINEYIAKVEVLTEALPYIKYFNGKIVLIKYGGSALSDDEIQKSIIKDIVLMKLMGIKPVIVHGGGAKINETLNKLAVKPVFSNGLRVTDEKTMEIVEMVLSGNLNKQLVSDLQSQGIKAVGISGKDSKLLIASKQSEELGFVGKIERVNPEIIFTLIDNGFIPVISPVGCDDESNTYNINADCAASAIAQSIKAAELIFLTDTEGVLRDFQDKTSVISELSVAEAEDLIKTGVVTKGMIPKMQCSMEAVQNGVTSVHILDGRIKHALLLEIFTQTGIGTMLTETKCKKY